MKPYLYASLAVIALLIIADFTIPGKVITDTILGINSNREQYYNAAQNHHYSYKVATSKHEFNVEEDFISPKLEGKEIEYAVSRIFDEVNWYKTADSNTSFYSLRIVSGLVLPLLALIAIIADYKFKRNIDILVFVLQVLLLGNLVYLLL